MENQNIEWKKTWHDEYLKLICGFANAEGGELHIGRNNEGKIVGLENASELWAMLPLKIRRTTGIVANVNLTVGGKCVVVKVDANPYPISYHGKYYLYSDGTTLELTGNLLDEFILCAQGRMWDSVPIPHVRAEELDVVAFNEFRSKALASERLTEQELNVTDEQLLQTLKLKEGDYLKRAAVLLFHKEPEFWITGAYVKIGFFGSGEELVCQDVVHGSLLTITDKVLKILFDKYYLATVSYEDTQRIEKFSLAKEALRETILNAIAHKDYASGVPVQIKVYNDRTIIYNTISLQSNWIIKKLLISHGSNQPNPLIAGTFYSSGMTDAWGSGIDKIITECKKLEKPIPIFHPSASDFMVIFYNDFYSVDPTAHRIHGKKEKKRKELIKIIRVPRLIKQTKNRYRFDKKTSSKVLAIIRKKPTISIPKIAAKLKTTTGVIKHSIKALKEAGLIKRVGNCKNGQWIVQ